MARQHSGTPPPVPEYAPRLGTVVEKRSYQVITPMLGGGSKVQHPDAQTVVRASQIRGLLRYWWRATRGGQYQTVTELKHAEALIWGGQTDGTMLPSAIAIDVYESNSGNKVHTDADVVSNGAATKIDDVTSRFSYVLWPLRPQNNTPVDYDLRKDVTFSIAITYPERMHLDLHAALWAWETFGGIGGRTRRGLGALRLDTLNDKKVRLLSSEEFSQELMRNYTQFVWHGVSKLGIPHIYGIRGIGEYQKTTASVGLTTIAKSPADQWLRLVQRYRAYRQERYYRNVNGSNRPFGSSVWPDANAIRSAFKVQPHTQSPYKAEPHVARAQLGLPVGMSFMPAKFDESNSSRTAFMLDNAEGRHASPLIFRPCAVEGGAIGLIIVLGNSRIDYPVRLSTKESRYAPREQFISATGNLDILNHGDDTNNNQKPHGPTNTADVLAGVFAFMKNA